MNDETIETEVKNDETIETEVKNEEGDDVLCDEMDVKAEDVPENTEEPQNSERPYVSINTGPRLRREGSIWNSPLGLAATVFLATKVIDLAHRVVIEKQKSKRTEK